MYKKFLKIISLYFLLNIFYLLLTYEKRKIKEHLWGWVQSTAKAVTKSVCTGGKAAVAAVPCKDVTRIIKKKVDKVPCTPGKELVSPKEDAVWQLNDTDKPKSSCSYNFGDYFVPKLVDNDTFKNYNDYVKSLD